MRLRVAALVLSVWSTLLPACTAPIRPASLAGAGPGSPQAIPAIVRLSIGPLTSCQLPELRGDILRRLNALRASGATCGRRRMMPAAPLAWSDVLFSAAARHSLDMAEHGYVDHEDPHGRGPGERLVLEGYPWRSMAENIAGGDGSVESVMHGWERSAQHCQAMLDPAFTQVGVACVERPRSDWGTYWTMELARPR